MDREQLRIAITRILANSPRPLKAKEILAAYCRQSSRSSVTVTDINSILYSELRNVVEQDASFRWTINDGDSTVAGCNRRNDVGREIAEQHIEEARRLSELLGGTDVDVKKYFFELRESELEAVLDEYEKKYGASKREYAEKTLPRWRCRRTQMSGLVAERLFNLLPPRMPLPVKYEMVQTLWQKYSPRSDAAFVIGADCDPTIAGQEIERHLLGNVTHYKIPEPLEKRFAWLSSGDVEIRQTLLNHFLDQERCLISSDARTRTEIILKHLGANDHWTESIKQVYTIGGHRIELFFDRSASGIRKGRPASPASIRNSQPKTAVGENSGCLVIVGAIVTTGVLACLSVVLLLQSMVADILP